jgi:transposase
MMRPDANVAVFVCVAPVDMRKQAATLALIVEQSLKRNIFEPALWVFSNERRDRIKIVYWQRNGLCLWSKRLEGRDRFTFPRHIEGETVTIRGEQLEDLLAGFDLWRACQSLRGFAPDLSRMRIAAGSKSGLKLPSLATKLSVTR